MAHKFHRLMQDKLDHLPVAFKQAENNTYHFTDFDLCLELVAHLTGDMLFSIQQSDIKNKKEFKIALIDKIIVMMQSMKEHRKDLEMEDND